ncbi:hypothetical protein ACOZ4L_15555 (plasmid) [Haloplanus ruber]|uniref:DUF4352 domain-containing protein n=1 Tax=Haloplanus ruber TaxID=869892 RepID=A0ABD6CUL9_9EURY|nr:hypothetical protein [Haloplanus ruber]
MKRRRVLATLGTAAFGSIAGCAGEPDRGSDESTRTDETTTPTRTDPGPQRLATGESTTVADGVSVTVADPRVQSSIVAYSSQFLAVQREDGIQFVVVAVNGDIDFEPSSFVLERNGVVRSPPQTQQYVRSVTRECGGTCIGVPVKAEAAESAAIAYRPDGEVRAVWELDDPTVAAFPHVPDLRLQNAIITEQNGDVGVEFSVDNVGERNGIFLGLIAPAWLADAGEPVGFIVPRGETVTETVVPSGIQRLSPDEAGFATEPTADTRYFEIGADS